MKKINFLFLGFALALLATRLYGLEMEDGERFIRVIGWMDFLWLGIGWVLANFQKEAGLPDIFGKAGDVKKWFIPFLVGICFALLDVLVIEFILRNEPHQTLPPYTQPFPYSVFLYFAGGLYMELFYKLIPLTVFLLIFEKYLRGNLKKYMTFLIIFLLSIWEPISQLPTDPLWFVVYAFASGFAFNFLQIYFFRKMGWLYSLLCRMGLYLIWHVMLGIWIEFFVIQ
ncbi:hypothetical protein [Aquiflexum gelatinilyticum]|uniref:hypothetical protein n=1 Tax=Aquiflexum gelatinilyticum TaxID=2961943 RepID=UPI00216A18A2|nr:hypothetical protein [Aquiflexum gelatinilyticum]MCS4435351.1 hypothetical protein [Aquiflexum gelatinilyticum]